MKITERDKLLLVVLAIILVVTLAIMMPGVGVMSCNTEIENIETQIDSINTELALELSKLREMGISQVDADNYTRAGRNLDTKILQEKEEAARYVDCILANTDSSFVDQQWVKSIQYIGAVIGSPDDKIFEYNAISDVSKSGNETRTLIVDGAEYELTVAWRSVPLSTGENADKYLLTLEYTIESYNENAFGALVLYLQQIAAKGSLYVTNVQYNPKEGIGTVEMYALMTANSDLLNYKAEIEKPDEGDEE